MKCQHCHKLISVEDARHCPICIVGLCPECYDRHMAQIFPLNKPTKRK